MGAYGCDFASKPRYARDVGGSLARDIDSEHNRCLTQAIGDRAGLWAGRDRVRREFNPVELSQLARLVLTGLDTTEDASDAAEPGLRRRA